MAAERAQAPTTATAPVETKVARTPSTGVMMGEPGQERPEVTRGDGAGVTATISNDEIKTRTGLPGGDEGDEPDDPDLLDDEEEGADEGEPGDEGSEDEGSAEDLPEFDPSKPETVAAYEKAYLTEQGGPDLGKLGTEYWANAAKGKAELNEGTIKFLTDAFAVSEADVRTICDGLAARSELTTAAVHEAAGGEARFKAMVEWGVKGGYTKTQRERFNAAMSSGDPEAMKDAVALLSTHYEKATGSGRPSNRRRASPARDAAAAAPASQGPAGFENPAEYRAAWKEARKSGDLASQNEVRRRLKASSWYGK